MFDEDKVHNKHDEHEVHDWMYFFVTFRHDHRDWIEDKSTGNPCCDGI